MTKLDHSPVHPSSKEDPGTAIVLWQDPAGAQDAAGGDAASTSSANGSHQHVGAPQGGPARPASEGTALATVSSGGFWQRLNQAAAFSFKAAIWCFVGGMASSYSLGFGSALVAWGLAYAYEKNIRGASWLVYGCMACLGSLFGVWVMGASTGALATGIAADVLAAVVVAVSKHRLSGVTAAYLMSLGMGAALAVIDFTPSFLAGVGPYTAIDQTYSQMLASASSSLGLGETAVLEQSTQLVVLLWPCMYMALAACCVALAYAGNFLGTHAQERDALLAAVAPVKPGAATQETNDASRAREQALQAEQARQVRRAQLSKVQAKQVKPLSSFMMPRWPVVAAVVAAVATLVAQVLPDGAQLVVLSGGLSALTALRVVFCLQGLALMNWWFMKRQWGCFMRLVLLIVALNLEATLFVVSIAGLVDVLADPRGLRKARTTQ